MPHHPLVYAHVHLLIGLFLTDGLSSKGEKNVFQSRFVYGYRLDWDPAGVEQGHDVAYMLFRVLETDVHFIVVFFHPGDPGPGQCGNNRIRIRGFDSHDITADHVLEVLWGIKGDDLTVIDDGDPVA